MTYMCAWLNVCSFWSILSGTVDARYREPQAKLSSPVYSGDSVRRAPHRILAGTPPAAGEQCLTTIPGRAPQGKLAGGHRLHLSRYCKCFTPIVPLLYPGSSPLLPLQYPRINPLGTMSVPLMSSSKRASWIPSATSVLDIVKGFSPTLPLLCPCGLVPLQYPQIALIGPILYP